MFLYENKVLAPNSVITQNEMKIYPETWRNDLARYGIAEVPDPILKDDRYWYNELQENGTMVYVRKSHEQITSIIWNTIKQKRDDKIANGGCKVGDKWYHSDTHSKLQQLSLFLLGADLPAGLQWKTMDGSFVMMTQTLAASLYQSQITKEQTIFAYAEALRIKIKESSVPEDIDINDGWPVTFQDEEKSV